MAGETAGIGIDQRFTTPLVWRSHVLQVAGAEFCSTKPRSSVPVANVGVIVSWQVWALCQSGALPPSVGVRFVWPLPSAFMTKTYVRPLILRSKAIIVLSGDHAGLMSGNMLVVSGVC